MAQDITVRRHEFAFYAAIGLIVLGVVFVVIRLKAPHRGALADTGAWRLTYEVRFWPTQPDARIQVALPDDTAHARIFRQRFHHPEASMDLRQIRRTRVREAVVTAATRWTETRFIAEFDMQVEPPAQDFDNRPRSKLSKADRAHYLRSEKTIQTSSPAVTQVLRKLRVRRLPDAEALELIFKYCTETIVQDEDGPTSAAATLEEGAGATLGRARAMVALCRARKIPARLVTGFILENYPEVDPHV